MKRLIFAVAVILVAATTAVIAGSGTVITKDGSGQIRLFGVTIDTSGNYYSNFSIVDGVAAAFKATVTSGLALLVDTAAPRTLAGCTASAIVTGGTAVALVTGPVNGGWITNPVNASAQGIATVENAYIDGVASPGSTDAAGNGTTSLIVPGQQWFIPALPSGATIKGNATTSGHKLTCVVY